MRERPGDAVIAGNCLEPLTGNHSLAAHSAKSIGKRALRHDGCGGLGVPNNVANDYWPLTLYDVRESWSRDNLDRNEENATGRQLFLGGVMHCIELDVNNLRRWLAGQIGASGSNVVNEDEPSRHRHNRCRGGTKQQRSCADGFVD